MSIIIPEEILKVTRMTEAEMRQEIAVMLFQREKLTLAQASRFAGIHRMGFQHLLASRHIPIHYGVEDFEQDIQNLRGDRQIVIVVSDTSPINNLAAINQLYLLHQLYGKILIPEAVYRELTDPNFVVAGAIEVQTFDWIQICTVKDRAIVELLKNDLDIGEAEAIALAVELQSDQVLIDERRGRQIAGNLNLIPNH